MKFGLRLALIILIVGTGLAGLPTVALGQDVLDQFPLRQQTRYFDFRYKRNSSQIDEIARFSNGFIKIVNRDFFAADFDYPVRVCVLEDRDRFKAFVLRDLHIQDPPAFGIYLYSAKMFATYETSGLGTFAHEILHPLVARNLAHRPSWTDEGIPTFFEKFYGYWKGDELVLLWGFQNPWRIEALGTNLTQLNLEQIISDRSPSADESKLRMVSLFLWEQGKFRRFLKMIAANDKRGYPSYFEGAMEMPLERVIPLWQNYLHDVERRRTAILSLPVSTVFNSEAEFRRFTEIHGISQEQVRQID